MNQGSWIHWLFNTDSANRGLIDGDVIGCGNGTSGIKKKTQQEISHQPETSIIAMGETIW